MWRNLILLTMIVFILVGCVDRDPETLAISLNEGVDTIEVNSSFNDAGATATLSGRDHAITIIENTLDITQVGRYIITYQTSYRHVTRTITRIVDVIDQTPPFITLNPGIDTVILDEEWEDAGVTVTDNSGLPVTVTIEGEVITSMMGEYRITYTAEDAYGNISEIVRYVHVINP